MMLSTMRNRGKSGKIKIWAVLFWLLVWQITASLINQEIFIVSPVAVIIRLFELVQTGEFWLSVFNSFLRIVGGFFSAIIVGSVLAILSSRYTIIKQLFAPFMLTVKSIPVASFVILSLFWFSAQSLAIFVSFLMVLPIIYINVLEGITQTDKNLLEMAKVFRINKIKKAKYIYFFEVYPFFHSALTVSLGLCWKSGIAAEVIGIPNNSIGEHLFNSKIYLDTASLFAWTVVILFMSLAFEKIILFILSKIKKRMERT